MILALRIGTASVWILFGLVFKVFNLVPRHRRIVAAVLGERAAVPVTVLVGLGETLLGAWILSGLHPVACAAVQTAAIVAMNALELRYAKAHLLAPVPMVLANLTFLAAGWYLALHAPLPR